MLPEIDFTIFNNPLDKPREAAEEQSTDMHDLEDRSAAREVQMKYKV